MTERQDLRPLSTEDLLPEHDRDRTTHADDQYRADGYQDSAADRADDTTDTADRHSDGYRDSATGRVDETGADRPVVSDEYDDVEVDAENRGHVGTDEYDERPAALDDEPVVEDEPAHEETVVAQKPTTNTDDGALALFSSDEVDQFRTEWRGLQSDFVDSPRDAVQHADQLVAQVMQSLATTFADHKRSLESQWSQGEQVETEELRVALRQYRAFFDKLLTV